MATIGDGDIVLTVPAGGTPGQDPRTPFEDYADSVLAAMRKILRRQRSQQLYENAVGAADGWHLEKSKLRAIGEAWAYIEVDVKRTGGTIVVPSDGDFPKALIAVIDTSDIAGEPNLNPRSEAGLWSSNIGRLAAGHVNANGNIWLDAINSGADVHDDDIITLAGMFPLDDWFDSEA